MSAPTVTVVVPTHQRRASVVRLLRALQTQELPTREFEAVVAVDRSTDGTGAAVDALETAFTIRRVDSRGRGRAAACNAGVDAAAGRVIVLLDDDMEPSPSLLSGHLAAHRGAAPVCVIGAAPVRVDTSSSFTERYVAQRFDIHLAKLQRDGPTTLRDFYSGNASIPRSVFLEIGGFDESFTAYGNEDLELAFRLQRAGVALRYDASAVAHQRYTKGFAGLARDTIAKGRTAVLLAGMHPDTFDELQLSQLDVASRRWRVVRALLLATSRRRPAVTDLLVRAADAAERSGLGRRRVFYAFMLDYFYWAGAAVALAGTPRDPRLDALHRDVHDGPIRLLLHR